jgi:hypothetical protein
MSALHGTRSRSTPRCQSFYGGFGATGSLRACRRRPAAPADGPRAAACPQLAVLFGLPALIILVPFAFSNPTRAVLMLPLVLLIPGPRDVLLHVLRDVGTGMTAARRFMFPGAEQRGPSAHAAAQVWGPRKHVHVSRRDTGRLRSAPVWPRRPRRHAPWGAARLLGKRQPRPLPSARHGATRTVARQARNTACVLRPRRGRHAVAGAGSPGRGQHGRGAAVWIGSRACATSICARSQASQDAAASPKAGVLGTRGQGPRGGCARSWRCFPSSAHGVAFCRSRWPCGAACPFKSPVCCCSLVCLPLRCVIACRVCFA